MPTGGGSVLADNIYHVFHDDMKPDEAQSLLTQGAVSQVASTGLGVGLSKTTGSGWTGRGPEPNATTDQALIDNLVRERVAQGKPREATLAQAQLATTGRTTPVVESDPNNGMPADPYKHAEQRAQRSSGLFGGRTVAVDQDPCGDCEETFGADQNSLTRSTRIIVPRQPSKPTNSGKTAAIKAGEGKAIVRPDEVMRTHFAPPIIPGQPMQDRDDEE